MDFISRPLAESHSSWTEKEKLPAFSERPAWRFRKSNWKNTIRL